MRVSSLFVYLWSDFRNRTGNRLPGSAVIGHLKLDRVSQLQVLDGAFKLAKVEKEPGLALTALYESIRMLKREKHHKS